LPVRYEIPLPPPHREHIDAKALYIHTPRGRRARAVDSATERFVDLGASQATVPGRTH
jgi:magnesium-protoporphyrin IX monomethyl ester (oxidative) cyclase